MRKAPFIDVSVVQDAATVVPPIKVCMHALRRARTDYRGMRTATALIKEGFEVSILDVEYGGTPPIEEDIGGVRVKHMLIRNWETSRRFEPWFFIIALWTFVRSLFWLIRTPADIYHAVEVTALPACYIAARLRRKPLIFEAYELPMPETDVAFWRRLNGLFTHLLAKMLPRCVGVIATSPLDAEEIRKRFRVPEVCLVRNIPAYRTVRKSDRLRQHLGLSPSTSIALYQGGLQTRRRIDKLVSAAAFLEPDIVIVIRGEAGVEEAQLQALIASEGVADRVKIIPPVPDYTEMLDWTASADIGLIPYTPSVSLSVRFILPNKLFEYIMAGVPVLATQLDAVVEVIRTYDVGQVVSSSDPEDIAAAINAMVADRQALSRMHHNALQAAQELCWENESQQLIHFYRDILAK